MGSETEEFWRGEFGDEYTARQKIDPQDTLHFFKKALAATLPGEIQSAIELGAGAGHNLSALRVMFPHADLTGVEINQKAIELLFRNTFAADRVIEDSILSLDPPSIYDLVLTKGVLIHIAPEDLDRAYDVIYRLAGRWILLAEYYNPRPMEIEYRGHHGRLWKRDFAGEMLELYPDLKLIDYGFVYHLDEHPQDDVTFFLLQKVPA